MLSTFKNRTTHYSEKVFGILRGVQSCQEYEGDEDSVGRKVTIGSQPQQNSEDLNRLLTAQCCSVSKLIFTVKVPTTAASSPNGLTLGSSSSVSVIGSANFEQRLSILNIMTTVNM